MPTPFFPEYLTIGAVIIGTRASWATNLYELRNSTYRGENRKVPGIAGTIGRPRRYDEVRHVLELVIAHDFDSDGNPYASLVTGQEANIAELEAIAEPIESGDGTREVTWHKRNGTTLTADCHVGPLTIGQEFDDVTLATLDLLVDQGRFT